MIPGPEILFYVVRLAYCPSLFPDLSVYVLEEQARFPAAQFPQQNAFLLDPTPQLPAPVMQLSPQDAPFPSSALLPSTPCFAIPEFFAGQSRFFHVTDSAFCSNLRFDFSSSPFRLQHLSNSGHLPPCSRETARFAVAWLVLTPTFYAVEKF